MAKLRLTIELEVPNDPEPGRLVRLRKPLPHIEEALANGATAGETTAEYEYTQYGRPDRDIATVTWRAERVE